MNIDEQYLPLHVHIGALMPLEDCIINDEEKGILTYPEQLEVSMPIEMVIAGEGELQLGSSPPMYYAHTSLQPVFHYMKITIVKND